MTKLMKLVVQFLESIPAKEWQCDLQESDGKRCVLGHLGLNPKSPLYKEDNIFIGIRDNIVDIGPVIKLNYLVKKRSGASLTYFNNGVNQINIIDRHEPNGIKKRAINAIKKYTTKNK